MKNAFTRQAVLAALMLAGASQFVVTADAANPFELTEINGLSNNGALVAEKEKCGSGSCGTKKDDHHCASKCTEKDKSMCKDGDHHCGSKDKDGHSCGSKDGSHSCGSKPEPKPEDKH